MKIRLHQIARQIGFPGGALPQLDTVRLILAGSLGLASARLRADTPLLGSVPQLDAIAAVGVLAALEDHFGIALDDDRIRACHFATVGSLTAFVQEMLEP